MTKYEVTGEFIATTVEEAVRCLCDSSFQFKDAICALRKSNKRLAFAVFCLSVSGYLTYRLVVAEQKKVKELEERISKLESAGE